MDLKTLAQHSHVTLQNPSFKRFTNPSNSFHHSYTSLYWRRTPPCLRYSRAQIGNRNRRSQFIRTISNCTSPGQEILEETPKIESENGNIPLILSVEEEDVGHKAAVRAEVVESEREALAGDESIWNQIVEIVKFSGPATGLWLCGPLMSLIDTIVIGQSNSIELAALGPGTVLCDNMCYVFMFLSISTSNLVATLLTRVGQLFGLEARPVSELHMGVLGTQARFSVAMRRLISPDGILYSDDLTRYQLGKLRTA
ncbi:hypothetical protein RJ639_024766 [Escallonia herrerae]|uniref:Uncharacterized protein n=1 Tax=Escallonia herrerae TaxID=1293975 RepID=A0AA88UTQ5_9ASTE|nr:hypothetical protein RJ639_024766 [Escallonia herrerae]